MVPASLVLVHQRGCVMYPDQQAKKLPSIDHARMDGPIPHPSSLIRLSRLAGLLPSGRSGKRRHVSAIYRWVQPGVRGIRLEAWRLPDGIYTTLSAWNEFVRRLTRTCLPCPGELPTATDNSKRNRVTIEKIDEVRASIRKRPIISPSKREAQSPDSIKP
jgi:hypothetical protein